MSMCACTKCGDVYDTDFQMEVDDNGDCICDRCFWSMTPEQYRQKLELMDDELLGYEFADKCHAAYTMGEYEWLLGHGGRDKIIDQLVDKFEYRLMERELR